MRSGLRRGRQQAGCRDRGPSRVSTGWRVPGRDGERRLPRKLAALPGRVERVEYEEEAGRESGCGTRGRPLTEPRDHASRTAGTGSASGCQLCWRVSLPLSLKTKYQRSVRPIWTISRSTSNVPQSRSSCES